MRTGWFISIGVLWCTAFVGNGSAGEWDQLTSKPFPVNRAYTVGMAAYATHCAGCHGVLGDGNGYRSRSGLARPRDFTSGLFKFRTTPPGYVPSDADLRRTIEAGIPGTAMQPFQNVMEAAEVGYLAHVVRGFATHLKSIPPDFVLQVPPAPLRSATLISSGRKLYETLDCAGCHGTSGRGNGRLASRLVDARGTPIRPPDFWLPGRLKSGHRAVDIYRTLFMGLEGTPMPALGGILTPAQLWQLAYYVLSLSAQPVPEIQDSIGMPIGKM